MNYIDASDMPGGTTIPVNSAPSVFFVNPVRFGYFQRVLERECGRGRTGMTILDVGCGGGFLSEEFAKAGFSVTGLDPAPESIEAAQTHALASGLSVDYRVGSGENLPFVQSSFDHVTCCDVLEHVDDVDRVVSEIARVLKPGGLFLYDTINRTWMSKLAVIKVMQDWPSTSFAEPDSHVWEKFIKPAELTACLKRHGLIQKEMRGMGPGSHPIVTWLNFRRRVKGKISFKELGARLKFRESNDLSVSYLGFAQKPDQP